MKPCVCGDDLIDHTGPCRVAGCGCKSYRPLVGRYFFKYQNVEIRCDTPEDVLALLAFREEHPTGTDLGAAEEILRALYETLPKCSGILNVEECAHPATKAFRRGEGRWCDTHAPEGCPDYPRAPAVRRAANLLTSASSRISLRPSTKRA